MSLVAGLAHFGWLKLSSSRLPIFGPIAASACQMTCTGSRSPWSLGVSPLFVRIAIFYNLVVTVFLLSNPHLPTPEDCMSYWLL